MKRIKKIVKEIVSIFFDYFDLYKEIFFQIEDNDSKISIRDIFFSLKERKN